ncbi:MAG TPA: AI-2E family transporter [Cellvibrio sp.]|nr:AI-2E family transporter [Cellvibrio sp.]
MNTRFIINGFNDVGRSPDKSIAISLKILVIIAILYTLYFCSSFLLPIFVAGFIALFSSPLTRLIERCKVSRSFAAAIVISFQIFIMVFAFVILVEPASHWLKRLPELSERLSTEMSGLANSFESLKAYILPEKEVESAVGGVVETMLVAAFSTVAGTTATLIIQISIVFVVAYFFLVYGDNLMRSMVRAQASFGEKKKTVIIFQTVRDDVSHYVLVIFIINIGLGMATALAMILLGIGDPILWGVLATILNFAPYLGPLLLCLILTGVGFIEYESFGAAFLVPGAYLLLNFLESQLITPTVLGKRFNMNPLLVVLWMFAWGWVWGAIGLLIAIPLLVFFKIISSHLGLIGDWVNVLDAEPDTGRR